MSAAAAAGTAPPAPPVDNARLRAALEAVLSLNLNEASEKGRRKQTPEEAEASKQAKAEAEKSSIYIASVLKQLREPFIEVNTPKGKRFVVLKPKTVLAKLDGNLLLLAAAQYTNTVLATAEADVRQRMNLPAGAPVFSETLAYNRSVMCQRFLTTVQELQTKHGSVSYTVKVEKKKPTDVVISAALERSGVAAAGSGPPPKPSDNDDMMFVDTNVRAYSAASSATLGNGGI